MFCPVSTLAYWAVRFTTLAVFAQILSIWALFVLCTVFPATLWVGILVGACIIIGVLRFPSVPLKGNELPWHQKILTNVNFRTPFVIAFVLPASIVFDVFFYLRTKFIQVGGDHASKIKKIQDQVLEWKSSGSKKRMCTARGGWLSISPKRSTYKSESFRVSVELYDVLEIDETNMTVRVEPGVNMGMLSRHLLARGFTIPVLPEMDDLSVGGLINGCGVEVASHKYGMFQSICTAFEILLADGTIKTVSKDVDADTFYAVPWSHGSIGFLLSATIRIIRAKKYVKLDYQPCTSESDFIQIFEKTCRAEDPPEFVEGLIYAEHESVVMTGTFSDEVPAGATVNAMQRWHKPWFAWHARTMTQHTTEYIPARAYYHRHTKGIFWELQDMLPAAIGNNAVFRWIFGWMIPPKIAFLKLIQPEAMRLWYEKQHVIQDMLVPVSTLGRSLKVFREHYDLYPLWVCPMKVFDVPGFISPTPDDDMFVDIGAYGIPKAAWEGNFDAVTAGVAVETFVRSVKGFQMLYADCYLSEQEFRDMFDHTVLDKVRAKTGADVAFPTPWEKMCKKKYESVFKRQQGEPHRVSNAHATDTSTTATTPRRTGLRPRK
eukprot:m.284330 g.284330  ORF g.284330 m.284330 type:complete len:603 (+) comp19906_c0_seq2:154-1962(+)